jgi:hypothetical protein
MALAAPVLTTQHGNGAAGPSLLPNAVIVGDLLSGLIPVELPGDIGWHPANPASGDSLRPEGLPGFTNDDQTPATNGGLYGLLNDFPAVGEPVKKIAYDLGAPRAIDEIRIFGGNRGADGRVFITAAIYTSGDGLAYDLLGYFQSDPSGTVNQPTGTAWQETLMSITDGDGRDLAITQYLRFDFYAVDNTQGENRDAWDGVNPFTGVDDGLTAGVASPLIWEIDVTPEPASLALLGLGALVALRRRS